MSDDDFASLKPGDKVAVRTGQTTKRFEITHVKRITPTGRISLENGMSFRDRHTRIGDSGWARDRLVFATDAVRENVFRQQAKVRLDNLLRDFDSLPTATLERLLGVLDDAEREEEGKLP